MNKKLLLGIIIALFVLVVIGVVYYFLFASADAVDMRPRVSVRIGQWVKKGRTVYLKKWRLTNTYRTVYIKATYVNNLDKYELYKEFPIKKKRTDILGKIRLYQVTLLDLAKTMPNTVTLPTKDGKTVVATLEKINYDEVYVGMKVSRANKAYDLNDKVVSFNSGSVDKPCEAIDIHYAFIYKISGTGIMQSEWLGINKKPN